MMIYKGNIKELLKKEKKLLRSNDGTLLLELFKNEQYSLAYGELLKGEQNKLHQLEMEEIYYFIEGRGLMFIDEQKIVISEESIIIVPREAKQKIQNTGNSKLRFIMKVVPPFDEKKEIILE